MRPKAGIAAFAELGATLLLSWGIVEARAQLPAGSPAPGPATGLVTSTAIILMVLPPLALRSGRFMRRASNETEAESS